MVKCMTEGCGKTADCGVEFKVAKRQHIQTGDENVTHVRCFHENCKKRPTFDPDDKAAACQLHKESDWKTDLQQVCESPGCKKAATFGLPGGHSTRCGNHKLAAFVALRRKQCQHKGCKITPSFGPNGTKIALACKAHSPEGWICLTQRYCQEVGCKKTPLFGPGKRPVACKLHKEENWKDVVTRRCEHPGCDTIPTFGDERSPRVCKAHNINNWPDVHMKRCQHLNCSVRPVFGLVRGKPTHCRAHMLANMQDVMSRRCSSEGCEAQPKYGLGRPEVCSKHNPDKWPKCVKTRQCEHEGCTRVPSFGSNLREPLRCKSHALPDDIEIKRLTCIFPQCLTRPTFGLVRGKPLFCRQHKNIDMYDVVGKLCQHEGCRITPSFGIKAFRPLVCSTHNTEGWRDVVSRTCAETGCDVRVQLEYTYCANHDTTQKRMTRVRENQVANLLRESASIPWTSWNRQVQDGQVCGGKFRPDFIYDLDTHILVVEVDEMQHASYECDRSRMIDIFNSCGGAPVTFVRYNPDGFKLAGKKSSADTTTRHELLLREVEKGFAGKREHLLSIVKLFFDNTKESFVQRSWIDVNDHRFTETSIANSN